MINVFGPINLLGFGIHNLNMLKTLMDKGIETNLTPIGQNQSDPYFEQYWKKAQENLGNFDVNQPSLYIFHEEFSHQASGNPLCVFSIFETNKLKEWSFNRLTKGPADIIIATTKRHKEILENNGIKKPIKVIHEGIDPCLYNTIPVDKHIDTGKFTYFTGGKCESRKNTNLILETFMETMEGRDVALIAHTFNPFLNDQKDHPFKNLKCWIGVNPMEHGFQYKGFDGKAHKFVKDKCDIYFTTPTIQTAQMSSLYHSANVGIQLSKGEAWDLVCTDLLACGTPVIASQCLGHDEYIVDAPDVQKELIVPITGLEVAKDDQWFDGNQGEWEIPDKDVFISLLENTYNDSKYEEKSDDLADYMEDNFSWEKAVDSFLDVINV